MLILLPPSEGKSVVVSGVGVDFGELSFPGVTSAREAVVDELVRVSASVDAAEVLKVGRTLSAEVERNVAGFGGAGGSGVAGVFGCVV